MHALCRQETHPEDITEAKLLELVDKYNNDPKIHGILVQLPLPKHINEEKVPPRVYSGQGIQIFPFSGCLPRVEVLYPK